MHKYLPLIESREQFPVTQKLRTKLTFEEHATIEGMSLRHVLYMPQIRTNTGLLTALVERWHFETCMFHWLTGEMSITLEDASKILRVRTYEHITVTRPIHFRFRGHGESYVYVYRIITSQP